MRRVILLFLYLIAGNLLAQNQTIPSINHEIVIDGKLDDLAWKKAKKIDGFNNFYPINTGKAKKQTTVRIFHNKKNLYISAVYNDITDNVQLGSLKRDDVSNSVASSDAFIIVLDPYNQQQNGYYFGLNMGSTQVDALIERTDDSFSINASWDARWNAKAAVNGNQKIFEIEIPLKALGYQAENNTWGVLFYSRDIKANEWTSFAKIDRNYKIYDLRFSKAFKLEGLPEISKSRITITPSVTANYQKNVQEKSDETMLKPSLDFQYSLSSSLKLDATINPDFSQIDVDEQVTNLTRFAVNFPERRNFFLENSDLFSGLGVSGVNPFYSRRIGASSDIKFGLKLSGNLSAKTRLGILNVSTQKKDQNPSQNYGAIVVQRKLSDYITGTGFLINRQETDGFQFKNDYNRVTGINFNYKSKNNKWTGSANYGRSFTNNYSDNSSFYNAGIWFSKLGTAWTASIKKVEKNYITNVGFVPRLSNYDPISNQTIRESYSHTNAELKFHMYPKSSKFIDSYRYFFLRNDSYWDEKNGLNQSSTFFNNAIWFKNLSSVYANIYYEYENLKYSFDLLKNGNFVKPGVYNYLAVQLGYNSINNKPLLYNIGVRYGSYYNGYRSRINLNLEYRLLPIAKLRTRYIINTVDLKELGKKTFHLTQFTGEIFFSNRLNWTSYVQYNNRANNFNVNSRLQWEYEPLSYVYLVISDNFNKDIYRTNWGIAFKMNYRLGL